MTSFAGFADVLENVSQTTSRLEKIRLLGEYLRSVQEGDVASIALFLSGSTLPQSDQRTLDVSWSIFKEALHHVIDFSNQDLSGAYEGDIGQAVYSLMKLNSGVQQQSLVSTELSMDVVSKAIEKMAKTDGKGSRKEKVRILSGLLNMASPTEARYLSALILGDMRTGVSKGLILEAISHAFDIPAREVRRAWGVCGNIGYVAEQASTRDISIVKSITISLFTPAKPMLASKIDDFSDLDDDISSFALEMKFDGARVQIHKKDDEVKIFSRRLTDVTESMPEIVELTRRHVDVDKVILDGEVIAVDETGIPYPFQVLMRRFGSSRTPRNSHGEINLMLHVFDILLVEDRTLLEESYSERRSILSRYVSEQITNEYIVPKSVEEAEQYFNMSKTEGNEGIMAKRLESEYAFGMRGRKWFKLKHHLETMDLVIVAAEWGHGRRNKWLSDYHLAVRDEGDFALVGKTFKGLTDKEFDIMTKKLLDLQIYEEGNIVHVKPQVIVEVVASEVQKSSKYESGMALRFARIKSIREDKSVDEAMDLSELESVFESQFEFKARSK